VFACDSTVHRLTGGPPGSRVDRAPAKRSRRRGPPPASTGSPRSGCTGSAGRSRPCGRGAPRHPPGAARETRCVLLCPGATRSYTSIRRLRGHVSRPPGATAQTAAGTTWPMAPTSRANPARRPKHRSRRAGRGLV